MNFQEANDLVRPLNIDEENSLTYKAAIIFFIGLSNSWDEEIIYGVTSYSKENIRLVLNNWKANSILVDGVVHADLDDENAWMEVILIAMVGAGEIVRALESKKQNMPKKTLNEHLFEQLDRLSNCDADNIELEMNKANSIINVAEQIISVARMKLDIIQAGANVGDTFSEIANIKQIENIPEKTELIEDDSDTEQTSEYFDPDKEKNWLMDNGDPLGEAGNAISQHSISKGTSRKVNY